MGKKEKNKTNKQESEIITKESFCAVCALFSLLAILILFTRSVIFGEIGVAVHAFLLGVFGYLAYPILFGALYLSVTGLLGKRFVKNRKAGVAIGGAVVCVALIVHAAVTYSWSSKGYLAKCFHMGEQFPKSTVFGWFGGLITLGLSTLTTKVGALVLFSLFTLFFVFLAVIYLKKTQTATPVVKEEQPEQPQMGMEIPVELQPRQAEQEVAPTYGGYPVHAPQSPAFTLPDEANTPKGTNGFSPFSPPDSAQQEVEKVYENPREFLFGSTPAENYRRNLIFDPNSNANRRPVDKVVQTPIEKTSYPSYTEAYQSAVNAEGAKPTKVFSDETYRQQDYADKQPSAESPYTVQTPLAEEPIAPMQPIEPQVVQPQEALAYPPIETEGEREEIPEQRTENWQDYKGLFSPSNPNVFGNDETSRGFAEETFSDRDRSAFNDDSFEREPFVTSRDEEERAFENREETRLGRDYFDEETQDDPYTLRSEFASRDRTFEETVDLPTGRGRDFEEVSTRFMEEETDRGRDVFLEEGTEERGREAFVEEPKAVVQPVREEKPEPQPLPPPKPRIIRPYVRVPLDDFDCRDVEPTANEEEVEERKATIIATLADFNVTSATIASVTFGPTVSRYNVAIPRNIPPKKVVALDQSIAISLHSSGVNIYPNYEDGVVSIEVPNAERQTVQLGSMLSGDTFVNAKPSSLMFAMGKDAGNRKVYGDISKMIHLLVAGASGMGKSVFLSALIISLIYKYSPEELRLILVDPKKTEFVLYNNLPHLMVNEIITDVNKTIQSLNWAIGEMNRRYGLFENMSRKGTYVVNLDQYNAQLEKSERLPKIVIIIDELADLMLAAKKDIEDRIQNLTQKARAAGIHLVVATQRPSTDVITGVIKSNLPTRIAFTVATDVDSRVILDQSGAQKLLGMGDFLYTMQGVNTPVRVQSAYIKPEDSQRVINFIKANNEAYYDESVAAYINNARGASGGGDSFSSNDELEPVYIEALRYVILSESASISMIQRKCSVGYNKAGKIVEWMEDMGYISSFDGAKARKVLITKEEFESKYGSL
ncbi:MAG: hypothetical protein IJX88_04055 [Clostridia bacterium]|nr:hypothetical protein [Clostridia bacterium]